MAITNFLTERRHLCVVPRRPGGGHPRAANSLSSLAARTFQVRPLL